MELLFSALVFGLHFSDWGSGLHFPVWGLVLYFSIWVLGRHFSVWVLGLHFSVRALGLNFYYTCYIYQHTQLFYDYTTWTMWFDILAFRASLYWNFSHCQYILTVAERICYPYCRYNIYLSVTCDSWVALPRPSGFLQKKNGPPQNIAKILFNLALNSKTLSLLSCHIYTGNADILSKY